MQPWTFIHSKLSTSIGVLLLWVIESEGSSPGRRGFKMAVAADGEFEGTIGGGIMEHKLVEKARAMLQQNANGITLVRQYHDKEHTKDQSGMICSGSQLIAFVPLTEAHDNVVQQIISSHNNGLIGNIVLTNQELTLSASSATHGLAFSSESKWSYTEPVDPRPVINIVGGGHVGLALSELMHFLGFYIKLYDNRNNLNTVELNRFADEVHIVDYSNISEVIKVGTAEYLVIMTFGYRDDKTVFQQLVDAPFFYKGMMGSETKIDKLCRELEAEGMHPTRWKDWHMPVGINIFSKTTQEIAVSIAAEIIKEKNKHLPTGRTR
jgi:xanthine dehydrogenase accessory factor